MGELPNMRFSRPIQDIIKQRYSCRTYLLKAIDQARRYNLEQSVHERTVGPFNTSARFCLVSSTDEEMTSLRELGTYGFIKNPAGFIIGAVKDSPYSLEDYGYMTEEIILKATDLGLGTCWLGGTFKRSSFSRAISLRDDEAIPAVVSVGYADNKRFFESVVRGISRADTRMHWNDIFFKDAFSIPLDEDEAGKYSLPLEMLRRAPSASNKQPWRIIKQTKDNTYNFYLQRTKGYYQRYKSLINIGDLQRVDMGIAMCHFQHSAVELGLVGKWERNDPGIRVPDSDCMYIVSWKEGGK